MRYRLMHISDLHAGWPFRPEIAEHLAHHAHRIKPDLLVISGDFVQRADVPKQWRTIKAYLKTLPQPQLVVAGNHDVPLYNLVARALTPYRSYRRHISRNLNPLFELPGLVVAGVCTAHGLTVDGGRVDAQQAAKLRSTLSRYNEDTCKIVVWHHPVVNPPGINRRREMRDPESAVNLLDECDVELLMCGHVHVAYVGNTLDIASDLRQGTIICQSGTSTSQRGHGREHGKNSFNLIEVDDNTIRIDHYLYLEDAGRFAPVAKHAFPRRSAGAYELPAGVEADEE